MTIDPKNPSLIYFDADGEAHNLLPLDADGPTEWKDRARKIKLPPLDPHKMYTPSEVASLLNVAYDTAVRELKKLTTILEIRSCTKLGLNFPTGPDSRHRTNFWPYGCTTGRCTPSSAEFMLSGGSPAFRYLAKPGEGEILIEADWSAQEVWIAAYLSGDPNMQKMLRGADPYIAFGEMAGVIPSGTMQKFIDELGREGGVKACKKKYETERAQLKAITLGVLYGKTAYTVAAECGITVKEAEELLKTHRRNFPKFWSWITWMVNEALATRKISTKLGWCRHLLSKAERQAHQEEDDRHKKIQNSLQNFQMQAHGAEMLRLACIYAAEKRFTICAPLHDAIFAVARADQEEQAIATLRECMERASKVLLGVAVPIEFDVTRWPDNFEPTDKPMAVIVWKKMMEALDVAEHEAAHPKPVVLKPHADEKNCGGPSNEWLSTNDRQVQDSLSAL